MAILAIAIVGLLAGCGGGGGSLSPAPAPLKKTALVVGSPSGPIYDELAAAYHIVPGQGSESSIGFDVLIYDGATVTPEQIDRLPTTADFLSAGKILIVLSPTQEDRQALEDHLGAAALVDSPAVAAFNTFSDDHQLLEVDMLDFPETVNELDVGPSSASQDASLSSPPDDETIRAQAHQWRSNFENVHDTTKAAVKGLSGISPQQYAAAAADNGTASASPADSSPTAMDVAQWLTPPAGIAEATDGSQFLTVQPFRESRTYSLPLQSIYYQQRFQSIYPLAVVPQNVDGRFLCAFLPIGVTFTLPQPAPTTFSNVNASVQTYRLLEKNSGQLNHEIIAHQLVTSQPTITPAPPASPEFGTENVSFCAASLSERGYSCFAQDLCKDFTQAYPISSLRGFNEQFVSTFTWDSTTAPLVTLDGWVPVAANDQTTVQSSQTYEKIVAWSVQGALNGQTGEKGHNVGLSVGGNYGQQEKWAWTQGTTISLSAWQMISPGANNPAFPARSIFDLRASVSPDNLANMLAFSTPPASTESPLSFSVGPPQGINNLQAQGLIGRSESDWSTRFKGGLLPAGKATLNVDNAFNYGEVYHLYTLAPGLPAGVQAYGALHSYTPPTIPIQLDFGKAIMQPPLPATWKIATEMGQAINGFFPIQGTVTLDELADIDTTVFLGAQLEPSGNTFTPKPSVIKDLPTDMVIRAGQPSATFTARAQRVGAPYNVQFYAFQAQGQQAGDGGLTIPAH